MATIWIFFLPPLGVVAEPEIMADRVAVYHLAAAFFHLCMEVFPLGFSIGGRPVGRLLGPEFLVGAC